MMNRVRNIALAASALALVACSNTDSGQQDIFEVPDGGIGSGSVGGGSGGSNVTGNNGGTGEQSCITEFGVIDCLDAPHFQIGLESLVVDDRLEGTIEEQRSLYACGAESIAAEPIDERVVLAREGECTAFRGRTSASWDIAPLDAGELNVFSNAQVAALVSSGQGCYGPEAPINPLFFESEFVTIDLVGGDDVDPYAGDATWPVAPIVEPPRVSNARGFEVTWASTNEDAAVQIDIAVVDAESVTTRVRCVVEDTGSVQIPESVAAELPDEIVEERLIASRTTVAVEGTNPPLYIVRLGTTELVY
jgi:hypothetical protein